MILVIVLQLRQLGWAGLYCKIEVYCSLVTSEIVLQYSLVNCIAGEGW